MGGFFGGLIAGAVAVLALGVVLSLTTPVSRKPEVKAEAPEVAEAPEPAQAVEVNDAVVDADLVELPPSGPESPDAESDSLDALTDIEVEPGQRPATVEAPAKSEAPATVSPTTVTVQTDAPAAPQAPAPELALPAPEAEPEVIAEAPPPPAPEQTPEPEVVAEVPEPEVVAEVPEPKVEEENPEPEVVQEEPVEEEAPQIAALQPDTTEAPAPEPVPDSIEPESSLQNNPIAVEGEEDTLPVTQPRVRTLPQIAGEGPVNSGTLIGKRVLPLTDRDDPPAEPEEEVVAAPQKPIEEHAASFENPEAKPLMSIILIDDEGAFGAEALQDFPYPLSFAISPSDPEAAEKMARHREAGFEVLALIDMHEASSAQDAEVSLSVWLEQLPHTVGILEGVDAGIQGNRKLADQVAAIAGDTGRGLVTQDNGLNTVQKLAARNGVPSSVVFRDFDGAKQDPKIMRRFLDQAAFRAGQEGAVVMLGRLRPETISALLLWGLEDRGSRVAMAPISAVMMKEVEQDDSGS